MTTEKFDEYWGLFKDQGAAALAMNHYDLAAATEFGSSDDWKEFLQEPEVRTYIETEISIIQDSELKKMIQGVNKSRSVGQAQLMGALAKLNEAKTTKEGPIFIYTYVPPSKEQKAVETVKLLDTDPFLK